MKFLDLAIVYFISIFLFSCAKQQTSEQMTEHDSAATITEETPVIELTEMASYPPKEVEQIQSETQPRPLNTSSSYSSYDSEESSDYWEEKRRHSPNDNYILGFDEDVDDVHDVELYMEDY